MSRYFINQTHGGFRMNAGLIKADRDTFAVYQAIYSNADTELHFDWNKRLNDTKWGEDLHYWVMLGNKKIGGIMVTNDCTRFPFLIEPFCDRALFWRIVIQYLKENKPSIRNLYSVLDADIPVLLSYGYKIVQTRKMMCRPTERYSVQLDDRFTCHTPDPANDLDEMTDVIVESYKGKIDYLMDPDSSECDNREGAREDLVFFLKGYAETNTLHHATLIRLKSTNKLVALCVAGVHPKANRPHCSYIADIAVLPEYCGNGLAKWMIQNALTNAAPTCDVMMLCVTVGNNAEGLYRNQGFWGGPSFTNMTKL